MPFEPFYHQCQNPNCDCPVVPGQGWCSPACRLDASYTEFDEDGPPAGRCNCGHEGCSASVVTPHDVEVVMLRRVSK